MFNAKPLTLRLLNQTRHQLLAKISLVLIIASLAIVANILTGCAIVAVGAVGAVAGTSAAVASDPRSTSTVVNDNTTEVTLRNQYVTDFPKNNIYVNCYNGVVLLTGQVANLKQKEQAAFTAKATVGVRKVYNYLEVRLPQSIGARGADSFTTTQVKAKLITLKDVSSNNIKVITTDNVVYLFGVVDHTAGKKAASAAASINGVSKVITLFEYTPQT